MRQEPSLSRGLRRPQACLSDFAIDRWVAGEIRDAELAAFEQHTGTCAACRGRAEEIRRERDSFAHAAPPLKLPARRRPSPVRFLWGGGGLLAAAAAFLLLARHPDDGTRLKGGAASLGFYVSHRGEVRQGTTGERVEPGDALRFAVTTKEPRYVAVLSVDGAKHASTYFPDAVIPSASDAVSGVATALPSSTVLDDALGDETLYGVFCPRPFDPEPLRKALEAAPNRAPSPDGCSVDAVHLLKVPKP